MNQPSAKNLRIVFAGTPEFAAQYLQLLVETPHQIVGVYTQPDRPAGRGKKLHASAVKQIAIEHDLPLFQPLNFKDTESREILAALKPDLMIVVAYGLILPQAVLDIAKHGCINVHASLLPRWRGAAPIQRAIESGDAESGVTIMQMDRGLDTGDMLATAICKIENRDTAASLHDKLIEAGKPALLETLALIADNRLAPEKQDDAKACYAHKIEKIEGCIDWSKDANTVDRQIRAFNPFPICYTQLAGQPDAQRIKVHSAFVLEAHSKDSPGKVVSLSSAGLDVQTGKGSIRIEKLQIPGKKALPFADILRGHPGLFTAGSSFILNTEATS